MVKKKIVKVNFIFDNYKKSWKYLKESKNFIFIITGIFFLFLLAGFFLPVPDYISLKILNYIKNLVNQTSSLSTIPLISFIFFNNLKSSFFGLILGIFFGVFSIFVAAFNGYLLGFVSEISVKNNGFFILWRLLPHGIFELPAVFISLGMGLKLGFFLFSKKKNGLREIFLDSIRTFLFIVVPLLIIAAVIEGSLIILLGH